MKKRLIKLAYKLLTFKEFLYDGYEYISYNIDGFKTTDKERIGSRILLVAHSLEKGMCFEKKKQNWGHAKSLGLIKLMRQYSKWDKDDIFKLGLNVLFKYSKDSYASKNHELIEEIEFLCKENKQYILPNEYGTKEIKEPSMFDEYSLMKFFKSRSSVRFYSDAPITDKEIESALEVSNQTPSACNRQTCKIYAIRNKEKMRSILNNQLGDQGWANGAAALFVVTSNISRFGGTYEHVQAYIDGGMYAMNFVWGLHMHHIASCFKMFVNQHKVKKSFKKMCCIPNNETPIVLILAGHYRNKPIYGPVSHRFDSKAVMVD